MWHKVVFGLIYLGWLAHVPEKYIHSIDASTQLRDCLVSRAWSTSGRTSGHHGVPSGEETAGSGDRLPKANLAEARSRPIGAIGLMGVPMSPVGCDL